MNTERVVVITGAAEGIGAVPVKRFLRNGDTIIAPDIGVDALARRISQDHPLHTIAADISSETDTARVAEFARKVAAHVDIVVNAAGYFPVQPFEEITPDTWRRVIDINLTGPYLIVHALLPLMAATLTMSRPRPASSASPARSPVKSMATTSPST